MHASADSSPLIALAACDALPLLDTLFESIRVPAAIFAEVSGPGRPWAEILTEYLQDKVMPVDLGRYVIAATGLGRGELEAMALYKEQGADVLLLDDDRARRIARLNGTRVSGSLGVLVSAKHQGHIGAIRPLLERARSANIYYSDALIGEALQLTGET